MQRSFSFLKQVLYIAFVILVILLCSYVQSNASLGITSSYGQLQSGSTVMGPKSFPITGYYKDDGLFSYYKWVSPSAGGNGSFTITKSGSTIKVVVEPKSSLYRVTAENYEQLVKLMDSSNYISEVEIVLSPWTNTSTYGKVHLYENTFYNMSRLKNVKFTGTAEIEELGLAEKCFSSGTSVTQITTVNIKKVIYVDDKKIYKATKVKNGAEYSTTHNFGDYTIVSSPNCIKAGWQTRKCSICEYSEGSTIPKLGHEMEHHDAIPHCETVGKKEYWHCQRCNLCFLDCSGDSVISAEALTVEQTGHQIREISSVAVTCEGRGNDTYFKCLYCGECFDDNTMQISHDEDYYYSAPSGHQNIVEISASAVTCEESGNSEYYKCTDCGKCFNDNTLQESHDEDYYVIAPLAHGNAYRIDAVSVTCEESGNSEYYKCPDCGKCFNDNTFQESRDEDYYVIAPLAHGSAYKIDAVSVTCEESGNSEYYKCPDCGKCFDDNTLQVIHDRDYYYTIPKGHQSMQEISANASTCEESGNSAYCKCLDCGKCFDDNTLKVTHDEDYYMIPPTGHQNMQTVSANSPTCEASGNRTYRKCSDCGKCFDDNIFQVTHDESYYSIPPTGHLYFIKIEAREATCEVSGNSEYYKCYYCSKFFDDDDSTSKTKIARDQGYYAIPPTGHQNVIELSANGATCEVSGNSAYCKCPDCGKCFDDNTLQVSHAEMYYYSAPNGHTLSIHKAYSNATCEISGNPEYWQCSACETCFSDNQGLHKITNADLIISPLGHNYAIKEIILENTCSCDGLMLLKCANSGCISEKTEVLPHHTLTYYPFHDSTTSQTGNQEYWKCALCNRYFMDASANAEYLNNSWIISKKESTSGGTGGGSASGGDVETPTGDDTNVDDSSAEEKVDPVVPVIPVKKCSIGQIKAGKKTITLKWKVRLVDGYQIQYSTSLKFKKGNNTKIVTVKNSKKSSHKITKLKSRKKYYVRMRSYNRTIGKNQYSAWSKKKSVTTK